MLRYEQREISILRLELRSIKTVAVDRYDSVGILRDNISLRVHTESPYLVFKLLCTVYDLALIEF